MGTTKRMTEAEIDAAIDGATAGHRLAGHEPSESGVEIGRRMLRGEIEVEDAVKLAVETALAAYDASASRPAAAG